MERKIGIIANNIEIKETIEKLYGDQVKEGKIIIDLLDPDKIYEQGKLLEKKGIKAIIARSGGYLHSISNVEIPVIQLKTSTLDILHAIKTAKKYNRDIVLLISEMENFDYLEWKEIINHNVIIEKFSEPEEIEGIISNYVQKDVVIVGGGIPCQIAQKYNLDFEYISASDDSIHDAISSAWEIVDSLYEQKYKNEVLNTTLEGVHDAVLAVDRYGKIILYNGRANELLKKDGAYVLEKQLKEVFPELGFMMDVLNDRTNKYNEIIRIKKIVVAANISLLEIDDQILGVLCSFQDITKLQNLERKIRYELNKKKLVARYKFEDIIANDQIMKDLLARAVKVSMSDSTAMMYGESGTGKEMIAQSIHNLGERKSEPFVAINCAALTESLLESELFGYEEGAFTGARKGGKSGLFELAHGGTIFLDEINSISINLQTKLLRVLEEKEVMRIGSDYVIPLDVRILAASNEELLGKMKDGSFRRDLFYRLSVIELRIPPLRERKKDIIPIFDYYLSEYSKDYEIPEIDDKLKDRLLSYSWPGNVRELKNIVQRYIIFGEFEFNEGEEFSGEFNANDEYHLFENKKQKISSAVLDSNISMDLKKINRFVEMKVIDMLENQGMSKNDIANVLGISRASLWNKSNPKNQ
ncbi:propionate catabolism operon transcriptional regulator [Sedimentibacter acidaminivorans]|uniref:Propionate catabolism operon transcriptional regulator n=1 Tax=Sedimentibacter acidaminivorans TaxID=913099 RepID=A0ABS4GHS0_9FIRM|nr:sigma 54-interacting transcriptional regulator [Sedimentibacter acidaminivorans]MBP1927248.1 propionate catabolism operon transcriptional regulator [Sedimentibacter acidaminivorans]